MGDRKFSDYGEDRISGFSKLLRGVASSDRLISYVLCYIIAIRNLLQFACEIKDI